MRNNLFRHNLTNHILAALLALLLWLYVATADLAAPTDVSKAFSDVALEVRNIAGGLVVTNDLRSAVTVTVRGAASLTDQMTKDSISAYLDLSNAAAGSGQYTVKVVVPQGLSAIASPSRLEVTLEQVLTVDVNLQSIGDRVVQNGQLLVADLSPQFVKVTGRRSLVERVQKAVVQTNWSQATTGARLSLPVQLVDAGGQEIEGLQVEPNVVQATVNRYAGKQVPVTVPTQGQLPSDHQLGDITVSPESVIVYAPQSVLDELQSISPAAIDLSGITDSATINTSLVLPQGVLAVEQTEVQVLVQVRPE